jgi:hypothetical protein
MPAATRRSRPRQEHHRFGSTVGPAASTARADVLPIKSIHILVNAVKLVRRRRGSGGFSTCAQLAKVGHLDAPTTEEIGRLW